MYQGWLIKCRPLNLAGKASYNCVHVHVQVHVHVHVKVHVHVHVNAHVTVHVHVC